MDDLSEEYYKKYGYYPDVLEYDSDGTVVGCGSDADYDTHFADVQNGNGYYDEHGHYVRFSYYE